MTSLHNMSAIITELVKDVGTWQRVSLLNGLLPIPDAIVAEILRQSPNWPEHPEHAKIIPEPKFGTGDRIKVISNPWEHGGPPDVGWIGTVERHEGWLDIATSKTDGKTVREHWYYIRCNGGSGSLPERCMEAAPMLKPV